MLLKISIKIGDLKGFSREYIVRSTDTLYSLSRKMKFDMDFPQDQLVLYKSVKDDFQTPLNRYSTVNLGAGTIDILTFEDILAKGERNFIYFYDTTNKKSVKLIIEGEFSPLGLPRGENEKSILTPYLLLVKGPNPVEFENGYVAFEDIPRKERHVTPLDELLEDEEDEEEDDDEDYDEEELEAEEECVEGEFEEVYDGNE